MALFRWNWLRRYIRRHTSPIPEDNAESWKRRLSFFYMFAAWNAFGVIAYLTYKGKGDWAKTHGLKRDDEGTPAKQWTKTLGIKDATVYRVSGFNVQKYEVHNETEVGDKKEDSEELLT